ncbi:MAG: sulfate ABC transporter, partial [Actinobacteria bacterium]|nr:sulfate ABC transporter [Actinomycetota bacterium]
MKTIRLIVIAYVAMLIDAPLYLVFHEAFAQGLQGLWLALRDPQMVAAMKLTGIIALVVTPCNVLFGVGASLAIVRSPSRWTKWLDIFIDVPLAVSPVIVGVMLELAYSYKGWFGSALAGHGLQI